MNLLLTALGTGGSFSKAPTLWTPLSPAPHRGRGQSRGRSEAFSVHWASCKGQGPGFLPIPRTHHGVHACLFRGSECFDSAGGYGAWRERLSLAVGPRALLWAPLGRYQSVSLSLVFLGVPIQETLEGSWCPSHR